MKSSTSIIVYIGNGVVKGGLVFHQQGKKPLIISSRKKDLKYYPDRDRAQIETLILGEFENLIKEIKTEDFPKLHNIKCGKPDNALIILSSPWYLSQTNIIKMQEATPFLVTDALVNKATSNIVKGYTGESSNLSVLEQNFLSVTLNGYNIVNPIGKKTKDLDINVFTSYVRNESVKRIEDIVSSNFHLHNIHIHSQSLVSFSGINDIYPDIKDYMVIDVTSELTEILIVKDGVLRDTASYPFGRYSLMQSIAREMTSSEDVAESSIQLYLNGKLEPEIKLKMEASLNIARKEWLDSFSSVLKQITVNGTLPKNLYLFASNDVSTIYKQFIESEEYQQFALTEGKFEVEIIGVASTSQLCDSDKNSNINEDLDVSISIGALFNNKKLFA